MVDIYGRSAKTKPQQAPSEDLRKPLTRQINDELSDMLNLDNVDSNELVILQYREEKL
ncbi:hypothetical protein CHS0354_000401, partial [Potamilus streckersoni]